MTSVAQRALLIWQAHALRFSNYFFSHFLHVFSLPVISIIQMLDLLHWSSNFLFYFSSVLYFFSLLFGKTTFSVGKTVNGYISYVEFTHTFCILKIFPRICFLNLKKVFVSYIQHILLSLSLTPNWLKQVLSPSPKSGEGQVYTLPALKLRQGCGLQYGLERAELRANI